MNTIINTRKQSYVLDRYKYYWEQVGDEDPRYIHLVSRSDRFWDLAYRLGRSLLATIRTLARGTHCAWARASKAIIRRHLG